MVIIVVFGVVGGMKYWAGVMLVVITILNIVVVWVKRVRRMLLLRSIGSKRKGIYKSSKYKPK